MKQSGIQKTRIEEKTSYWSIVWSQLKRNRLAMFGLWCIIFIAALAVFAPLVSLNRPFYFFPENGIPDTSAARHFPFIIALFDTNFFENAVDIFFNTFMVLSPLFAAGWFSARFLCGTRWKRLRKYVLMLLALFQLAAFSYLWFCPVRPAWLPSGPKYVNYRALIEKLEEEGTDVAYLFPPLHYSYREVDIMNSLKPPSADHLFGTDRTGRDVFVRIMYGTRVSLTIGMVAVGIYVFIGTVLGALAGYFGGWVDIVISRFIEIMLCFPAFFLILTLAAFIEQRSIFHIMVVIGVIRWTGVARLVRGEFLRQRNLDYVQAATALGFGKLRIIFRHVLPNAIAPVLVSATFGIARAIITEASLSFLGLGDTSLPSWGGILKGGLDEFKMWLILIPGAAIFLLVSVFNLLGEGLRDAMDPKLRQ